MFTSVVRMSVVIAVIAVGVHGLFSTAQATPIPIAIPSSDAVSLTSTTAGLNDTVTHFGEYQFYGGSPTAAEIQVMQQQSFAANGYTTPTGVTSYSFLNTNDGFTYAAFTEGVSGDQTPTNIYLGSDAAGAASSDTALLATTSIDAMGYLNVPSGGGTYTFSMPGADDAGNVYIGGNGSPATGTLINESNFGGDIATTSRSVSFAAGGYYPIEVFTYNEYVGGGGAFLNGFTISPTAGAGATSYVVVPEPSGLLLASVTAACLAVSGMASARGRRLGQQSPAAG